MSDQVWLNIGPGVAAGIDRERAMAMTEKDLADFYLNSVIGLGWRARRQRRREAKVWAAGQVRLRDEQETT